MGTMLEFFDLGNTILAREGMRRYIALILSVTLANQVTFKIRPTKETMRTAGSRKMNYKMFKIKRFPEVMLERQLGDRYGPEHLSEDFR